jgi:hypothetical protein
MKKIFLFSLFISLVLVSCGKSPTAVQGTETPNVQTLVATVQTVQAPTAQGGTPAPTKSGPNPEQLAKLMEGVDAWNAWREQNPSILPDLSYAKLAGGKFFGINLKQAKLYKAQLNNANLGKANLAGANLSKANLKGANLEKANLKSANLIGADLTDAILTNALLTNAKYDSTTIWPAGFDPVAAGAKLVVQ